MSVAALDINQFDALLGGEVGVQAKHLDRESDFVNYALSWTVAARKKLKVFNLVVLSVAVDVMHRLFRQKLPPKVLLHDVAVLKNFSFLSAIEIGRQRQPDVTVPLYVAPNFAVQKSLFSAAGKPRVLAGGATKALLSIKLVVACRTLVSAPRNFLSALLAREKLFVIGGMCSPCDAVALPRTIQRVAPVLNAIGIKKSGKHQKFLAAILASELNSFRARSAWPTMFCFVSDHARLRAIALCFSRLCSSRERSAAIGTFCSNECGRGHGFLQWFGNYWYTPTLRRCQVRGN
jgi:hypothetical protein